MRNRRSVGSFGGSIFVITICGMLLLGPGASLGAQEKPIDIKVRVENAASHAFWQALAHQPGFSFKYNGATIGPTLPAGWTTHEVDLGGGRKQVVIQEPDGLQVIWQTTEYPEYKSLEYTLIFKNTSSHNLAPLTDLDSLDLNFSTKSLGNPLIYSSGGGIPDGFFPPDAFTIHERTLAADVYPSEMILETSARALLEQGPSVSGRGGPEP